LSPKSQCMSAEHVGQLRYSLLGSRYCTVSVFAKIARCGLYGGPRYIRLRCNATHYNGLLNGARQLNKVMKTWHWLLAVVVLHGHVTFLVSGISGSSDHFSSAFCSAHMLWPLTQQNYHPHFEKNSYHVWNKSAPELNWNLYFNFFFQHENDFFETACLTQHSHCSYILYLSVSNRVSNNYQYVCCKSF